MAPSETTEMPVRNGSTSNGNGASNGSPSSYAARFNLAPHFIGGNHLEAAAPSKVKDFVANHDGHTVITRVRQTENKIRGNGGIS
jgi:acetyl-CoA carboxylase/biotin carboxylase 1